MLIFKKIKEVREKFSLEISAIKNSEQLDTKFNVLIKKTLKKKEKVIFKGIGIMLQILPQDKKSNDINNDKQKINELSNLAKEKFFNNIDEWNKMSSIFKNYLCSEQDNFKNRISDLLLRCIREREIRAFADSFPLLLFILERAIACFLLRHVIIPFPIGLL